MKKDKWLKLDLQEFADGDGFDLDKFQADFEASWEEPDTETESDEEDEEFEDGVDETETTEEDDFETEEDDETEEDEETDEEDETVHTNTKTKQSKEENAAFAQLRREKEELAAQNKLLEQVAAKYGMTIEQFQKAYQEDLEVEAAAAEKIPVEVYRKLNATEASLAQFKKQAATDKFNLEVEKVKNKFGLEDTEIAAVFDFIGTKGLHDPELGIPTVDFESAYKLANFDNLMNRKTTEAKQKMLADKKKRQKKSAKPHNTNSNVSTATNDDFSVDDVAKQLRAEGYI
jgi:hypothetical protein